MVGLLALWDLCCAGNNLLAAGWADYGVMERMMLGKKVEAIGLTGGRVGFSIGVVQSGRGGAILKGKFWNGGGGT